MGSLFLRGVRDVARQASITARQIVSLREAHRQRLTQELGSRAAAGFILLDGLFERPVVSVSWVREHCDFSSRHANDLVAKFADMGLLNEITGYRRNRLFAYSDYLTLLDEPV